MREKEEEREQEREQERKQESQTESKTERESARERENPTITDIDKDRDAVTVCVCVSQTKSLTDTFRDLRACCSCILALRLWPTLCMRPQICCEEGFRHATKRPSDMLLRGLKTCY